MPEAVLKISVEIHCMVCTGCLDDCIPTVSCKLQQLCSLPKKKKKKKKKKIIMV
jgi:hypothetical protein